MGAARGLRLSATFGGLAGGPPRSGQNPGRQVTTGEIGLSSHAGSVLTGDLALKRPGAAWHVEENDEPEYDRHGHRAGRRIVSSRQCSYVALRVTILRDGPGRIPARARRPTTTPSSCSGPQARCSASRTPGTAPAASSSARQRLRRPGRAPHPARPPAHEYPAYEYPAYEYRASMSPAKSFSSTLRRIPSLTVSCPASWVKSVSRIRNFLMDSALDTA